MFGMIGGGQSAEDIGAISPEHLQTLAKMGMIGGGGRRAPQNVGEGLTYIGEKINEAAWRNVMMQSMQKQQAADQKAWGGYANAIAPRPMQASAPGSAQPAAAPGGMIAPGTTPQPPMQPAQAQPSPMPRQDPRLEQVSREIEALRPLLANSSTRGFAMQRLQALEGLQMQINDPRNALQNRALELDIAAKEKALGRPNLDTPEGRAAYAKQFGMDEQHPGYKSYVLTGKMPRQDQQELTATDKKAILEADEGVLNNQSTITSLDQAKKLSPQAHTGWLAGLRATLGNNLPDALVPDAIASPESSKATVNYENLVLGQALTQLKATFGAAPTEGERQILMDLQASIGKPHAARQEILDRAIAMANKRLEFSKSQADGLRGGTYYKSGQGPSARPAPQAGASTEFVYNRETGKLEPKQ